MIAGAITPAERAARTYFDAWVEPDRGRRAALLEACFAVDGRIALRGQVIRGRSELAAAIDDFFADPRRLTGTLSSVIEAAGQSFRFHARVAHPDGQLLVELLDVGEVDADGRISALYTFVEPLAARDGDVPAHGGPAAATALAVQRYVELWSERDRAARGALLDRCFSADGRLFAGGRMFRGRREIAAMIDTALADPRGLTARRTSAIDGFDRAFRFAATVEFADGSSPLQAEDVGEVDGDARIAVLYAFARPLRAGAPA